MIISFENEAYKIVTVIYLFDCFYGKQEKIDNENSKCIVDTHMNAVHLFEHSIINSANMLTEYLFLSVYMFPPQVEFQQNVPKCLQKQYFFDRMIHFCVE